jgi:2-iminoacetate synthase ThiH
MLNPLVEAGLQLERISEAKPTQTFKEREPEEYKELMREPGFIAVLARKRSATSG